MKSNSWKQWILALGALTLSFSCQSQKTSDEGQESNCQEEQSCCPEEPVCDECPSDSSDDDMSSLLPVQSEQSAEPAKQQSSSSEKQEKNTSTPAVTQALSPTKPISEKVETVREVDLEALAKIFSIKPEVTKEMVPSSSEKK